MQSGSNIRKHKSSPLGPILTFISSYLSAPCLLQRNVIYLEWEQEVVVRPLRRCRRTGSAGCRPGPPIRASPGASTSSRSCAFPSCSCCRSFSSCRCCLSRRCLSCIYCLSRRCHSIWRCSSSSIGMLLKMKLLLKLWMFLKLRGCSSSQKIAFKVKIAFEVSPLVTSLFSRANRKNDF